VDQSDVPADLARSRFGAKYCSLFPAQQQKLFLSFISSQQPTLIVENIVVSFLMSEITF